MYEVTKLNVQVKINLVRISESELIQIITITRIIPSETNYYYY